MKHNYILVFLIALLTTQHQVYAQQVLPGGKNTTIEVKGAIVADSGLAIPNGTPTSFSGKGLTTTGRIYKNATDNLPRYMIGGVEYLMYTSAATWTPRDTSITSSATPAINTDKWDQFDITALTTDITNMSTNLTGTLHQGQIIEITITGTATRNISWGNTFVSSTITLPTATNSTNTLTVIAQYYTSFSGQSNKLVCISVW